MVKVPNHAYLLLSYFSITGVYFQGEFNYIGLKGHQKIEFGHIQNSEIFDHNLELQLNVNIILNDSF